MPPGTVTGEHQMLALIRTVVQEAVAPLQEAVAPLKDELEQLKDQLEQLGNKTEQIQQICSVFIAKLLCFISKLLKFILQGIMLRLHCYSAEMFRPSLPGSTTSAGTGSGQIPGLSFKTRLQKYYFNKHIDTQNRCMITNEWFQAENVVASHIVPRTRGLVSLIDATCLVAHAVEMVRVAGSHRSDACASACKCACCLLL